MSKSDLQQASTRSIDVKYADKAVTTGLNSATARVIAEPMTP